MTANMIMLITFVPIMLFTTFLLAYTPYYIRRTDCFGVAVPEKEYAQPELEALRKNYRAVVLGGGFVITLASAGLTLWGPWMVAGPLLCIFLLMGLAFGWFLRQRAKVLAIKQAAGWSERTVSRIAVALTPDHVAKLPSAWWSLVFWGVAAVAAGVTIAYYPGLPTQIPMHYNLVGEVDRYAAKSPLNAGFMVGTMIFLALLFTFVLIIIRKSRVTIATDNQEESLRRVAAFRRGWSIFTILMATVLQVEFLLMQLMIIGIIPQTGMMYVTLAPLVFIFAGVIWMTIHYGQGGSRLKMASHKDSEILSVRDDDRYWKLGSFYYNPDDPALFVEKRFGIGWTSNFARPFTWVLIGILIAAVVGTLILAMQL